MVPAKWLDIIYRDPHIIVLSKPAGLLSVPGRLPRHKDSLSARVEEQFPGARVVHRLDCETSGVMMMALTQEAQRRLNRQFHDRHVDKSYIAVCAGVFKKETGEVNLPMRCDWENRPKQIVDLQEGKTALTRWRILSKESDTTRVSLVPITGRSHQLRVHMKAIGHPILGDTLYAPENWRIRAERLLLHAESLAFIHPETEKKCLFEVPCPF